MLDFLSKRRALKLSKEIPEFAHMHKDLIVIVADPKTDQVTVAYKDQMVMGRIKSAKKGGKAYVLAGLMRESQFETSMDGLVVGLLDTLKVNLRLPSFNQFAQVLDGGLFNISKALRKPATAAPTGAPALVGAGLRSAAE